MTTQRHLQSILVEHGVSVPTASNRPTQLNDSQSVWLVETGAVDIFLLPSEDGEPTAAPQHLMHCESGRLLFGIDLSSLVRDGFIVIAKGIQNTSLRQADRTILSDIPSDELKTQIDLWVEDLAMTLVRLVGPLPTPQTLLSPGVSADAGPGVVSSRRRVVWLSEPPAFTGLYMGLVLHEELSEAQGPLSMPLTTSSWFNLFDSATIECRTTADIVADGTLIDSIRRFHDFAFAAMNRGQQLARADDANLQFAGAMHRKVDAEEATNDLVALLKERGHGAAGSDLMVALSEIGRNDLINFRTAETRHDQTLMTELQNSLDVSAVRCRRIELRSEEHWWNCDGGSLLAFKAEDKAPVALLPGLFGRYWEFDPASGSRRMMNAARARQLETSAFMFYAPLKRKPGGLAELARLAKCRVSGDLARFFVSGVLGGLVMLLPALMVGLITERIIPDNDRGFLYPAIAGLAAFALLGGILHILQGTALVRMEGRITVRIEAALWDRILRLPSQFLNRYPVGDIAARGMAFRSLRDSISGAVADSLVSVVFLFPAFALMIVFDPLLGAVSTAFGLISLIGIILLARKQIPWHRRILTASRELGGLLFQLVNGVSKIQAGCASSSAYARWARKYRDQKVAEIGLAALNEHLIAFSTAVPIISAALVLAFTDPRSVPIENFLVIFAALTIFQAAVLRLGVSFTAVASILPVYELMMPIMATEPEGSAVGQPVTELNGDIRFDRVSFSYPGGPPILDEVSISARPGEYVAITGESGSGKSTLFRIALGIESPSSGAVYYDGRDMAHLNLNQLRRRIGAAPQDTVLMPENIRDNMVGEARASGDEDVWHAAKLAAIDSEIARMPMGMATSVGLCRANLSGGECQRIQIAAALIGNPRIVMLDESTNWLDNDNQAEVMKNIERLSATRLIIAHRLSTLQQADKIYVLERGRVAQEGSFEDLAAEDGPFQDLMRRQKL